MFASCFKPFLLAGLLLAAVLPAHAQASLNPGYIVRLNGDTVRGKVDNSTGVRSYEACRFRADADGQLINYTPAQLHGYGFWRGRTFQTGLVPAFTLPTDPIPADTATQRRFVEVLVRGASSLYEQQDASQNEFFYVRLGTGRIRPLIVTTPEATGPAGQPLRRGKAWFRGELGDVFKACPAMQTTVGSLMLTASSLIAAVQGYNACMGGGQVVSAVAAGARRHYFVFDAVASLQASTLRYSGETNVRDVDLAGGLAPVVGVGAQLHSAISANRLAIRLEILLERQRYSQAYQTDKAYPFAAYQEVDIRLAYLRVPLMLRYSPLSSRLRPFLEVGGSLAVALQLQNDYRYRGSPSGIYSAWDNILPNPRHLEEGLLAGAGFTVPLANRHQLGAGVRVEFTNGFSDAQGIETVLHRSFFLVSYSLTALR